MVGLEPVEAGLALARIGPARELVEEHERAGLRVVEDAREVPHVSTERRQALREALIVADVGEDDLEDADDAPVAARDRQAGADHERDEAHRLEGDGLSAGVRAADDHRAAGGDRQIARHDRVEAHLAVTSAARGLGALEQE